MIDFQTIVGYGEIDYIKAAQHGGPLDRMTGIESKGMKQYHGKNKIPSEPDQWDLLVLVNIFHDHYDYLFCKPSAFTSVEQFFSNAKCKMYLLQIKDFRNRRAHDSTFSARDDYFMCEHI